MKKNVVLPVMFVCSCLSAQSIKTVRVKGADIKTGGDYRDGQYISQDSAPEETGYIKGFYVSDLITQEQFEAVMKNNPSAVKNPKAPVTNVTMKDALRFCEKLNENGNGIKLFPDGGLKSCVLNERGFRLPLEEEWELAQKTGAIQVSDILEWTMSQKNTAAMRTRNDEDFHTVNFEKYVSFVARGNNSAVKRQFLQRDEPTDKTGFRIVRSDMTEWGFPEQKSVPAGAKANVTFDGVKDFVEKAMKTAQPDKDGLIHLDLTFAEVIDSNVHSFYPDTFFRLNEVLRKYDNLRVNLDLKNCVFKVPESLWDVKEMKNIELWRINWLESVILPDDTTFFEISECENLKYVQTNVPEKLILKTFDECYSLKYVFVPRNQCDKDEIDDISLVTCHKTQVVWNTTASDYKKNHSDFDEPAEAIEDPSDCTLTFDHKAYYYGNPMNVKIQLPPSQIKKQTFELVFVYEKNRTFELHRAPVKFKGKSDVCEIKKIDTREFYWPDNDENDEIYVCPVLIFEDGTVYSYYINKIFIKG